MRVFLNAPLSALGDRLVNEQAVALLQKHNFTVYSPPHQLPVGTDASAQAILEANARAVIETDVMVSVLDKPGLGVAFELGVAWALGKPIIAFRSDIQDYLGKIIEGVWMSLPQGRTARTLEEL